MKKATDQQLINAYAASSSVWKVAQQFGMCGQSVHERLHKLGVIRPINIFSTSDKARLRRDYADAVNGGCLDDLANDMGRTKQFLCRQARLLGLTNSKRNKSERHRVQMSDISRQRIKANGHPKGMLGKKHSEQTRAKLEQAGKDGWNRLTTKQKAALTKKQLVAKFNKRGTLSNLNRIGATWRASWRTIGGHRKFFRSRWEANYARYLQWLVEQGQIVKWEHEPETFWFDGIRRGCVSYLPDFRVTNNDGSVEYHEVKGWMDARSKTKIKRMKKYHPAVKLVVVDGPAYRRLNSAVRSIIGGWEQ
jgi:hypothetical protein